MEAIGRGGIGLIRNPFEAMRRRPGMWIGVVDATGIVSFVREVVLRAALPEYRNAARKVTVTCHPDHAFTIEDDGRGLPMDPVEYRGVSHPRQEGAFTEVRGGAFSPDGTEAVDGFLGWFAVALNAYSEWLDVRTTFEGVSYRLAFSRGGLTMLTQQDLEARSHGTILAFKPDLTVFSEPLTSFDGLTRECDVLSARAGIPISVIVESPEAGADLGDPSVP